MKRLPEFGAAYRAAARRLQLCIAEVFGLALPERPEVLAVDSALPLEPASVREADLRMVSTEKRDLMRTGGLTHVWDTDGYPPYDWTITPWSARTTEVRFLERFAELTARRTG